MIEDLKARLRIALRDGRKYRASRISPKPAKRAHFVSRIQYDRDGDSSGLPSTPARRRLLVEGGT